MEKCNDFPAVVVPLRPEKAKWVAFADLCVLGCMIGNLAIWGYLQ